MFARLAGDARVGPHLERFAAVLAPDALATAADAERCFANRNAQPLIVLYGLAVAGALAEAGLTPGLVAGYSVGELTAHSVAGGLPAFAALELARRRAACMDRAAPAAHGMLAVRGLHVSSLDAQATEVGAVVAIRNGADHAVLAGPQSVLATLAERLAQRGAHVVPLPITVPAHSHWLADGVEPLRAALAEAPWHPHRAPVLAGFDARPVTTAADAIASLARQIAAPIEWERVLDVAVEMGATAFFELGPGCGLVRMVRERRPELPARAFDEFASCDGVLAWLGRLAA
jgi:[acyl-carrier-protein] S-malonyltransferase